MKVERLESGGDPAFDAFVRAHPAGTFFHQTAWRDQVTACVGHEPRYLVAKDAQDGGAITGVLPAFLIRSPLHGRALVSVPFGVYGGILARDAAVEQALLDAARRTVDESRARYCELRYLHRPGSDLPGTDLYFTFLRDLPADPEECLTIIPRKSRASTRQARDKHELELAEGPALLDGFYDLFVQNKRALGSPVFARSWFARLLERFGGDVLLHGVTQRGTLLAAVLSFVFRDTLMPYYSGQLPGSERTGCMNFLYWKLMEAAVQRGLKRYDFGRSRANTGAFAFKKNMGFEPTQLHYQYVLANGASIPAVNPSNPKFSLVSATWSRLPLPLVKLVGPRLMRYFP